MEILDIENATELVGMYLLGRYNRFACGLSIISKAKKVVPCFQCLSTTIQN